MFKGTGQAETGIGSTRAGTLDGAPAEAIEAQAAADGEGKVCGVRTRSTPASLARPKQDMIAGSQRQREKTARAVAGGDASRKNSEDGGKRQENVLWAGPGCGSRAVRYAAQYSIMYSMAHTER
jgi:hypothetical protein